LICAANQRSGLDFSASMLAFAVCTWGSSALAAAASARPETPETTASRSCWPDAAGVKRHRLCEGYFRSELVECRGWLKDASYADLVALSQFLPGPCQQSGREGRR